MFLAHDPQTLQEVFAEGGPVMWPLLGASVLGFAVIVERAIHFARRRIGFSRFVDQVCDAVVGGKLDEARGIASRRRHPLAALAVHFLDAADRTPERRAELVQREGGMLIEAAERWLPLLRLVVQIAPILGLLGTVHGLLLAFWALESITGPIRPSDVAGGIGSALTTTVFGLSIAIPASGFLLLFEEQVDRLSRRMGFLVSHLEEALVASTAEAEAQASHDAAAPAAGKASRDAGGAKKQKPGDSDAVSSPSPAV